MLERKLESARDDLEVELRKANAREYKARLAGFEKRLSAKKIDQHLQVWRHQLHMHFSLCLLAFLARCDMVQDGKLTLPRCAS